MEQHELLKLLHDNDVKIVDLQKIVQPSFAIMLDTAIISNVDLKELAMFYRAMRFQNYDDEQMLEAFEHVMAETNE